MEYETSNQQYQNELLTVLHFCLFGAVIVKQRFTGIRQVDHMSGLFLRNFYISTVVA